jgi:hypothetical protein
MHAWRLGIQEVLLALAEDPAGMDASALRARLDAKLEVLEARIETALDTVPQGGASPEELDNMYRLLGAYRVLSEALLRLVQQSTLIDWRAVREERF